MAKNLSGEPRVNVRFLPSLGVSLVKAVHQAVRSAKRRRAPIILFFSGRGVEVGPRSNPFAVARRYKRACLRDGSVPAQTNKHIARPASFSSVLKTYKVSRKSLKALKYLVIPKKHS